MLVLMMLVVMMLVVMMLVVVLTLVVMMLVVVLTLVVVVVVTSLSLARPPFYPLSCSVPVLQYIRRGAWRSRRSEADFSPSYVSWWRLDDSCKAYQVDR